MTVTREDPRAHPPPSPGIDPGTVVDHGWRSDPGADAQRTGAGVVATVRGICPYLVAEGGAWRGSNASREHRCTAVQPPTQPTIAKQRGLCLVPAHHGCPAFAAARDLSIATTRGDEASEAGPWTTARTTPVLLEPAAPHRVPLPARTVRTGGQALIAGLMVIAFAVLVASRATTPPVDGAPRPSAPVPSASGAVVPLASPSATPASSPTPSPSESPSPPPTAMPSPSASAGAVPSTQPSPGRTYTVRSGDTLVTIAARFGSTVKAIAAANGLSDPRLIRIGQVLVIP